MTKKSDTKEAQEGRDEREGGLLLFLCGRHRLGENDKKSDKKKGQEGNNEINPGRKGVG